MQSNAVNTCRNCGNQFSGKYCNNCGEKVYDKHDRSLWHLAEEFLHFASHFEGAFFTSLKTIFKTPGKFSLDYCDGIRKKYFKPLSFFLLLVILYLLFPLVTGLNEPLQNYYAQDDWSAFVTRTVKRVSDENHLSMEAISDIFARKSEKISKFLLFILIPLTALFFWLFGFKNRKYFFDNFIFSTEVNSFYLIWVFFLVPALIWAFNFLGQLLFHFSGKPIDQRVLIIFSYLVSASFVAVASKRFYGFKTWYAIIFSIVFIIAHFFIVYYLYKFILFVLVINQIH